MRHIATTGHIKFFDNNNGVASACACVCMRTCVYVSAYVCECVCTFMCPSKRINN